MTSILTTSIITTSVLTEGYCGHCGGEDPTSDPHRSCQQQLAMEPPRFCPQCRRRMKVQVTPLGWTADCSRHGRLAS
ncbi:biotin synthase auxiliary protein BsaP [Paenarthrobacter aurescens]|uniref:biotin synthase auxiliary protein BsaP n=1 Tax=Paenarthrobacter aurescens TaxID=43663 RepID=UPI003F7531E7